MTPDVAVIEKPLRYYRTDPMRASQPLKIEPQGGMFGAGLIRNVSLVTAGEARGHDQWVDQAFVDSVAAAVNQPNKGVKVRFTHPSLSGDGLGRYMGRATNGRTEASTGQAVADIHLAQASHDTPDGDLGAYVLNLAEEDPSAFAISIAFERDKDAEKAFRQANSDAEGFTSPDSRNSRDLRHVRLKSLVAADFVDTPAANPGGLFHRGHDIAAEADQLCEYAFGLTEEKPDLVCFSADVDRVAAFAQRFLDSRGLSIEEKNMAKETTGTPGAVTQEELNDQLAKFGEGILSKIDEKLAVLNPPDDPEGETFSEDELKADQKRVADLYKLAASAGLDDPTATAEKWTEQGLSVVEAKAALADRMLASNKLTDDSGAPADDPDAKLKAEYRSQLAIYQAEGVSEEEFIASAKITAAQPSF